MNRFASIAIILSLAGCSSSFLRDSDSGTALAPDAGTATDGSAALLDATTNIPCASGIDWLDTDQPVLSADLAPGGSAAISADAEGFVVIRPHVDHDDWGYWVHVARAPGTGPAPSGDGTAIAPYDSGRGGTPPRVFASTDPSGRVHAAALVGSELWWSSGPRFDAPFASIAIDRLLGAVAFEEDGVLVETHDAYTEREAPPERGIEGRVTRHGLDGSAPSVIDGLDPAFGFDFWAPSLATTTEGPWFGILADVDFPPTVQLQGPRAGGWDGSSSGVQSYDFFAVTGAEAVVSEDCGESVRVARRGDEVVREATVIAGRDETSGVATRLATDGNRIAVVFRGDDGNAHVAVLDRDLAPIARDTVPGSGSGAGLRAGSLGIAAMPDGTFAALTTSVDVDAPIPEGEISVRRFRVCE